MTARKSYNKKILGVANWVVENKERAPPKIGQTQ